MQVIRVLLADLTGILRDVVRGALDREKDMAIVGEVYEPAAIQAAVMAGGIDVVIWGTEQANASNVGALLPWERPPMILAVEDDGRYGSVWQLRHQQTGLGQLSPDLLVDAIRRVCAEDQV